jgi:hypothetical protein
LCIEPSPPILALRPLRRSRRASSDGVFACPLASVVSPNETPEPSIWKLVMDGLDEGGLWILDGGPVWWGYGHGTSEPCIVCRRRIGARETQYDLTGPRVGGTVAGSSGLLSNVASGIGQESTIRYVGAGTGLGGSLAECMMSRLHEH